MGDAFLSALAEEHGHGLVPALEGHLPGAGRRAQGLEEVLGRHGRELARHARADLLREQLLVVLDPLHEELREVNVHARVMNQE